MKIHEYNQMMAYLTRPATPTEIPDTRQQAASGGRIGLALGTERETTDNTQFASLTEELQPGSLKDEMLKDEC